MSDEKEFEDHATIVVTVDWDERDSSATETFPQGTSATHLLETLSAKHGAGVLQEKIAPAAYMYLNESAILHPHRSYRFLIEKGSDDGDDSEDDELESESSSSFSSIYSVSSFDDETFQHQLFQRDKRCIVTGLHHGCASTMICPADDCVQVDSSLINKYDVRNGLWLSGHWKTTFERYQWTVLVVRGATGVEKFQIKVLDPSLDCHYQEYDGKELHLDASIGMIKHWPSPLCLDEHRRTAESYFGFACLKRPLAVVLGSPSKSSFCGSTSHYSFSQNLSDQRSNKKRKMQSFFVESNDTDLVSSSLSTPTYSSSVKLVPRKLDFSVDPFGFSSNLFVQQKDVLLQKSESFIFGPNNSTQDNVSCLFKLGAGMNQQQPLPLHVPNH